MKIYANEKEKSSKKVCISECLYYVAKAFEMEMYYMKGYAFWNKILKEEPSYKEDAAEFFENWYTSFIQLVRFWI